MKTSTRQFSRCGVTFTEFLVILGVVTIGATLLLPALARPRCNNGQRIRCVNQLKQIGLSFRIWANDNGDVFPFATNGPGTASWAETAQVFRHFAVLSNELVSPKILLCPKDSSRTRSTNFTSLDNTNLSYFVGLDATEANPQHILSGDRNITGGQRKSRHLLRVTNGTEMGWTTELHSNFGNINLADGSVQQVDAARLTKQVASQEKPVTRFAIP